MTTITVDRFDDVSASDGETTLREALAQAQDGDTITFSRAGRVRLTQGELAVFQDVIIDGDLNDDAEADVIIDGQFSGRVAKVTGDATLDGLVLTNGFARNGGGLFVLDADVTIKNSAIRGNSADNEAGPGGELRSEIGIGAGIYTVGGALTVVGTSVAYNEGFSSGAGGGIASYGTDLTLLSSSLYRNVTAIGGGILAQEGFRDGDGSGSLSLINTTIGENFTQDGGGIYASIDTTITHSTIANNNSGSTSGTGTGIKFDQAASLTIENSIIMGNTSSGFGEEIVLPTGMTATYSGVNIFDAATFMGGDAEDLKLASRSVFQHADVFGDPDLAFNGGHFKTFRIRETSAAVGGATGALPTDDEDLDGDGDTSEAVPFDGRGEDFPRVFGAGADIGAVEFLSAPPVFEGDLSDRYHVVDIAESDPSGIVVYDVNANDGKGGLTDQNVSYRIVLGNEDLDGDGQTPFQINPITGVITLWDKDDADPDSGGVQGEFFLLDVVARRGGADPGETGAQVLVVVEDDVTETFVVDSLGGFNGNFAAGNLTFLEAVILANGDDTRDTILFDPSLAGAVFDRPTRSLFGKDFEIATDTVINGDIDGDGTPDITLDGGGVGDALLTVSSSGPLGTEINGLRIINSPIGVQANAASGSHITLTNMEISGSSEIGLLTSGRTTLDASVITGNGTSSRGVVHYANDLTIRSSTIENNNAQGKVYFYNGGLYTFSNGGGVFSSGSRLKIYGSILRNNSAEQGGGLSVDHHFDARSFNRPLTEDLLRQVTIVDSYIHNNSATKGFDTGGGIYWNSLGALDIWNSSISENTSAGFGGGLGGYRGEVSLVNTALLNNSATQEASALAMYGALSLTNVTVGGNFGNGYAPIRVRNNGAVFSEPVNIANSIIAGNQGADALDVRFGDGLTIEGANIFDKPVSVYVPGPGGTPPPGTEPGTIIETDLTKIFAAVQSRDPNGIPNDGDEFTAPGTSTALGLLSAPISATGIAKDAGDMAFVAPDTRNLDNDLDTSEPVPWDIGGDGSERIVFASVDLGAQEIQNNPPVFLGPLQLGSSTIALAEAAPDGTVILDAQANDGDGGAVDTSVSYRIFSGNPDRDGDGTPGFAIDADGKVSISDTDDVDFEQAQSVTLRIQADDGANSDNIAGADLIVNLLDNPDTFIVDDLGTAIDGNFSKGEFTLAEAIDLAERPGNTADTIRFSPDLLTETLGGLPSGVIGFATGQKTITTELTIDGDIDGDGTPDIGLDGLGQQRLFEVASTGNLTLKGLSFTNGAENPNGGALLVASGGQLDVVDSRFANNFAPGAGGAISSAGDVTVLRSSFVGNESGEGGAVHTTGSLDIRESTFTQNFASTAGGALVVNGSATVVGTEFQDNESLGAGGAIAARTGVLTLHSSTLWDNEAVNGGAVQTDQGADLSLVNVTLVGNQADGGGLASGGAVQATANAGAVSIDHSTIAGNFARVEGGGLHLPSMVTAATLGNSIVTGNYIDVGSPTLPTLVSNPWSAGVQVVNLGGNILPPGTMVSGSGSFIGNSNIAALFDAVTQRDLSMYAGDEFDVPEVKQNGGWVATAAINPAGPARDNGDANVLVNDALDLDGDGVTLEQNLPFDARGPNFPREDQTGVPDVGAFEVNKPVELYPDLRLTPAEGFFDTVADAFAALTAADAVIRVARPGEVGAFGSLTTGVNNVTFIADAPVSGALTLTGLARDLTVQGDANVTITGNSRANTLTSGDGGSILTGLDDDDILRGGAGADLAMGGSGFDIFEVDSARAATVLAALGNGDYDLGGPEGNDALRSIEMLRYSDGLAWLEPDRVDLLSQAVLDHAAPTLGTFDYDLTQNTGGFNIQGPPDAPTGLILQANAWRALEVNRTLAPDTWLRLTYDADAEGIAQGVLFDTNLTFDAPTDKVFQIHGSGALAPPPGFTPPGFMLGGGPQVYNIPVGAFTTGLFPYLVLVNASPTPAESVWSSFEFFEADALEADGALRPLRAYAPGVQDQGTAAVSPSGEAVTLAGNAWKRVALDATLTADTVLAFEFSSADLGEIAAIGFDSDGSFGGAAAEFPRFFQLGGSELRPNMAADGLYTGTGGQTQRIEIAVGEVLQGTFADLVLVMDDDADASGSATFSQIDLFERAPLLVSGAATRVLSYDPAQDAGTAVVSADQSAVTLADNAWKRLEGPYTIAPETWLSFELNSADTGEILGIGFDSDAVFQGSDLARIFQLGGADARPDVIADFRTYSAGDGTVRFDIPVGQFYTGSFANLVLVADDDGVQSDGDGAATFGKITLLDGPPVLVDGRVAALLPYDPAQDLGTATVAPGGRDITLQGNAWKSIDIDRVVTPDTVLSFTFESSDLGEIAAIGFDTDRSFAGAAAEFPQFWQLGGSEIRPSMAEDGLYTGSGSPQRFEIAVGEKLPSGTPLDLVVLMDDDIDASGVGTFSDISLFERAPVLVDGQAERALAYDPIQDEGTAIVSRDQSAITLQGNAWKRLAVEAVIGPETWLSFDVTSADTGEILGIGFDTDAVFQGSDLARLFQLGGADARPDVIADFRTYSAGDGTVHYDIPVGAFYQGTFENLLLVADDDGVQGTGTGQARFANIELTEGLPVFAGQTLLPAMPYAPAIQDVGTAVPGAGGREIALSGNAWKGLDVDVDITPDTLLAFEFSSADLGEIAAIGFDRNLGFTSLDLTQFWQLGGSDIRPEVVSQLGYSGPGFTAFEIAVGAELSGQFRQLVAVMDDDGIGAGQITGAGVFRDIMLLKNPFSATITTHGQPGQDQGRALEFADGGAVRLDQNAWKAIALGQSVEVDDNSVLEVEFRADVLGEVQGIGLDRNSALNEEFFFKLAGSQDWGNAASPDDYVLDSGWQSYALDLSVLAPGSFDRIVLGMDNDAPGAAGDAFFRNVVLTGLGAQDDVLVVL